MGQTCADSAHMAMINAVGSVKQMRTRQPTDDV
jgi:hypothetical protein